MLELFWNPSRALKVTCGLRRYWKSIDAFWFAWFSELVCW